MTAFIRTGSRAYLQPLILSFVFLTIPGGGAALAVSTTPSWKPAEFISGSYSHDNQRGDRFLAYDHYGVPAIVAANNSGSVTFARQVDGIGWQSRNLGGSNAKHASIAFDRHELPGIAYGNDIGLNYTYFSNATMLFQNNVVDTTAMTGRQWTLGTSIAFDLYGRPAVAASVNDGMFGDLRYVSDSNLDGVLSSADANEPVTPDPEQFPSLVFDRLNRPITSNRYLATGTSGDLDIWMKDPFFGWKLNVLSGSAEEGTPDAVKTSIAIDPIDGFPAVAWTNWTGTVSQLWYAKWNQLQSQWNQTLVTTNATNQLGNESLAFDPADGRPAIAYGDNVGNVNFAWFNGAVWNTQVANTTATTFAPRTSLAFNEYGHGFPAIAYITNNGAGTGDLRFIVDPPSVVPEPTTLLLFGASVTLTGLVRRRAGGSQRVRTFNAA